MSDIYFLYGEKLLHNIAGCNGEHQRLEGYNAWLFTMKTRRKYFPPKTNLINILLECHRTSSRVRWKKGEQNPPYSIKINHSSKLREWISSNFPDREIVSVDKNISRSSSATFKIFPMIYPHSLQYKSLCQCLSVSVEMLPSARPCF
jgi:hypothetical protein